MLLDGSDIHWEVCKEYGVECNDKCMSTSPKSVEGNEEVKLLRDSINQTDRDIHHMYRRPDIVIQKKRQRKQSLWT